MASFTRNTAFRRPGAASAKWSVKPKLTANDFIATYSKVSRTMKHKFEGSKMNYSNTVFHRDNKIGKIFSMMNEAFKIQHERHGNILNCIMSLSMEGIKTNPEGKLWMYDSRKSDKMPKNDKEYDRFASFMTTLVKSIFDEKDAHYICENINIAASFFIMFPTIPGFYISNKKLAIAKLNKTAKWECFVIFKEPVVIVQKQRLEHNNYRNESHNDVSRIPKLKERVNELMRTLEVDLDITFGKYDGNFEIHHKVSKKLSESVLGKNKYKKTHKIYQDFQKEKQKLTAAMEGMKAKANFSGIELDNGNVVTFKKVRTQTTTTTSKKTQEAAAAEEEETTEPVIKNEDVAENWEDIPDDWEDNSAW